MTGACLGFLFFVDNPLQVRAQDHPVMQRLAFASIEGRTTQTRLAAWRAGIQGVAERPLLGWGPENYIVPYGKYGKGAATSAYAHDRAHNEFVEEAATKGLAGAAAYVAIWLLTFVVVARYVKAWRDTRGPPGSTFGHALAMYVGTALVADLLLKQTLFAHIVGTLQYTLLLGFVIGLESQTRREGAGPRVPKRVSEVASGWLAHTWSRVLVVVLTVGVAGAATYSGVAAQRRCCGSPSPERRSPISTRRLAPFHRWRTTRVASSSMTWPTTGGTCERAKARGSHACWRERTSRLPQPRRRNRTTGS